MAALRGRCCLIWVLSVVLALSSSYIRCSNGQEQEQEHHSVEDYLVLGNNALSEDANARAIDLYEKGIAKSRSSTSTPTSMPSASLVTIVSLETNLATAYSAMEGMQDKVFEHYEKAILAYSEQHNNNNNDGNNDDDDEMAKSIVSQTAFFYGMELQEQNAAKAAEMYGNAVLLDPELWAAWANLGSVFQDHLNNYDEALQAYNQAYEILTEHDDPTDPPAEPRYILSQLQYRMGLCLQSSPNRKCATTNDPDTPVPCQEMAAHCLSRAVEYDPQNLLAKHMLASLTADATMKKASNAYVTKLFDDYAHSFEHSLVQELGYDGYARLRKAFDRAVDKGAVVPASKPSKSKPASFDVVLDAGCGTGLVGEQFRNISSHLIGVDLSRAILDEAEKLRPNLYDERIVGDVTEIIRSKKPLSLIVAADSFIYFGDLDPLFESIHDGLDETNGYIAFTLEKVSMEDESILAETRPDWRWQLTPSGRFAHRKEYVASVGNQHGLALVHYEPLDRFRHELGRDVHGHVFVMKKIGASDPTENSNVEL